MYAEPGGSPGYPSQRNHLKIGGLNGCYPFLLMVKHLVVGDIIISEPPTYSSIMNMDERGLFRMTCDSLTYGNSGSHIGTSTNTI